MASEPLDEPDASYGTSHKAMLHAFMAQQVMTFEQARPLLAELFSLRDHRPTLENDVAFEDFSNYINTINHAIEPFGYEIVSTLAQTAAARSRDNMLYVFVNTASDPQTQLATMFSADAIAFIKRLLDAMFETNNKPQREVMAVRAMDAIRLHKTPRNRDSAVDMSIVGDDETQPMISSSFGMKQAEETLQSLVQEGWLERSRAEFYSLSPRALAELRGWLDQTYNDPDASTDEWQRIKKCNACKEIVTIGQRCADEGCLCRLHNFCARGVFSGQATPKCPMCSEPWSSDNHVGEKAARGYQQSRTSDGSSRRRTDGDDEQHSE